MTGRHTRWSRALLLSRPLSGLCVAVNSPCSLLGGRPRFPLRVGLSRTVWSSFRVGLWEHRACATCMGNLLNEYISESRVAACSGVSLLRRQSAAASFAPSVSGVSLLRRPSRGRTAVMRPWTRIGFFRPSFRFGSVSVFRNLLNENISESRVAACSGVSLLRRQSAATSFAPSVSGVSLLRRQSAPASFARPHSCHAALDSYRIFFRPSFRFGSVSVFLFLWFGLSSAS